MPKIKHSYILSIIRVFYEDSANPNTVVETDCITEFFNNGLGQ